MVFFSSKAQEKINCKKCNNKIELQFELIKEIILKKFIFVTSKKMTD